MEVPKLQEMLTRVVPVRDLIRYNLTHLLLPNRLVQDLEENQARPIPQWFMRMLFDTGDTLFYWFRSFTRQWASKLPLNEAVFVGNQDAYKETHSMCVFAMRVSRSRVAILVYANPRVEKYGIHYSRPLTDRLMKQETSRHWAPEDWACLSCLGLDCVFEMLL